ncbi:hypothetical protein LX36DRAFT_660411 [Colletotrichum falcatum]|nr:hypothetical protein LX36DRAFT_660411 [Colletotrichum falcatum]
MSAIDSKRSEAALADSCGVLQSPDGPARQTCTGGGAPTVQTFTLLKIIALLLSAWANLLLLPLVGWNVASTTLFVFMRGLPFGHQLEGFLRLSYNMAVMEMGGYNTFSGFGKPHGSSV